MEKQTQSKANRIKTPRDAKGIRHLKILEKTTQSVFQSRIKPKSAENLKHCHSLLGARDIVRIDRQEWEESVGKILRIYENHRYEKKNALQNALTHINLLLQAANIRESILKDTTSELQQTSNYLRTLLDSMADIFMATDTDGIISEANNAAQKLSGFHRDELIGRPFVEFMADISTAQQGIQVVLEDSNLSDYELELMDKRGDKIPIMVNATLLFDIDNQVNGILINARDITELKKAQQAQERYAEELARANADLEEFASVASHDLQEPLKKVSNFASDLIEKYKDQFDEEAIQSIYFMIKQTNYMKELVKNVLAYSKIDTGELFFQQVDCNIVLDQAIKNLSGALDESHAQITCEKPLPMVKANEVQLIRVFQNIIGNAIKYRDKEKEKCVITISWERIEDVDFPIPDDAVHKGFIFTIKDNGSGIDPDFIDSIFDMFVRLEETEAEAEGSGMGLAICRKVITRHSGVIWAESELGEWSMFLFTIPD